MSAQLSLSRLAALLIGTAAVACAGPRVTADWSDPDFAGRSLAGERILVLCDAGSTAVQRTCQDRLVSEVAAAGGKPVPAPSAPGYDARPLPADQRIGAAREADATALLTTVLTPIDVYAQTGPDVSFGVGGWSGSRGSVSGAGVGIGVPVGGGRTDTAYAADFALTDVKTGQLMWTSRVTVPASASAGPQLEKLTRAGVDAARGAGFL